MTKIRSKQFTDRSCIDAAIDRLQVSYDRYDTVAVAFSGGKDSTACLNLTLQVAEERCRLPVIVYTYDEEAIPPQTVEYLARVAADPRVDFRWYCLPVQHTNACSKSDSYWYPWDPDVRDRWVRELPPGAITSVPGHVRQPTHETVGLLFPAGQYGTFCNVMGIRAEESISRHRAVAAKSDAMPWFTHGACGEKHVTNCYPIYDWRTPDVWIAPEIFGWDYNHAYDVMEKAGIPRFQQRCAPPFGDQPLRGLWAFKKCWPDLWERMVYRVPGAATAARYGNSQLYGIGVSPTLRPGQTWQLKTRQELDRLEPTSRREVEEVINDAITNHRLYAGDADDVPDAEPHPRSGFCWRQLHKAALRGNNKHNRTSQLIHQMATTARRKNGITGPPARQ
jgi:predicted phosphoadenosine phosphosulfate sulfurtransferase